MDDAVLVNHSPRPDGGRTVLVGDPKDHSTTELIATARGLVED